MKNDRKSLIILSAGGTGGHMTPAQALARDLLSRGFQVEILTDARGMKYAPMFEGISMHVIKAGTAGKGLAGKIGGAVHLAVGVMQAIAFMVKRKPALVIGFGGYPSVPGVYAAQKLKVPTIIHEQNAIIGKANAFLATKAERIAISMPQVQGLPESDLMRTVYTGNPVRPAITALYTEPYPTRQENGKLRILVVGGSLGATILSKIVPEALADLPSEYRGKLSVVQQCRESDLETTQSVYDNAGIEVELYTFIDDMAAELKRAHLVISRAGASSVAEVTTAGRPAIFVPYPHHKDQQQKMNADAIADRGGAWVMTEDGFTVENLRNRIELFFQNPEILFRAAEKSSACGKPDSARKLGNLATALVSGWKD
jgi:UDP-N-acetylglucosamine--N-acetylmuramyl-(pentapeptide) pyrophosphoryl-undecaprenol N-acetylglucosamine transferase